MRYDQVSCARGEMENRIKEQPVGLFVDCTRCHGRWANVYRIDDDGSPPSKWAWCAATGGIFHDDQRFGVIEFAS